MTADLDLLAKLLDRARGIDEWQACETQTEQIAVTWRRHQQRRKHTLAARIFCDSDEGRGEATLEVSAPIDRSALLAAIDRAVDAAAMATGPLWALPPPSAPARVQVADPTLADDPASAAHDAFEQLTGATVGVATVASARVQVSRTTHRAATSRGFDSAYLATRIDCDAVLAGAASAPSAAPQLTGSTQLVYSARRLTQEALATELAARIQRAESMARADALTPGRYDVVFTPRALAHRGTGLFAPYVAEAQAYWQRLGLSRAQGDTAADRATTRAGEVVASRDRLTGDGLHLSSDGTLPLALQSAPFERLGDPVRRFDLVRDGARVGVATDAREAALLGVAARGRVRNLVVAQGRHPEADLVLVEDRPVVIIDDLVLLDVDPQRGHFIARIGAATIHGKVQRGARPARDGWLSGNVFDLFASARRSAELDHHGCYNGPRKIRVPNLELISG